MTHDPHIVVLDSAHPESAPGCMAYLCKNCDAKVVVKLPVAVTEFTAVAKDFGNRHRHCAIVAPEVGK